MNSLNDVDIENIKTRFRASGRLVPLIVYDVDDILWPLCARIADRLGLNQVTCTNRVVIRENSLLTPEQQEAIIAEFANAEVFREMNFYEDVEAILRPCELGAEVQINSNSFTSKISELKCEQLLSVIPGLKVEQLKMNSSDINAAYKKRIDENTTIFVDDNACNVSMSPAIINFMPNYITWGCNDDAKSRVSDKNVLWRDSLREINQSIYEIVEILMRA